VIEGGSASQELKKAEMARWGKGAKQNPEATHAEADAFKKKGENAL